MAFTYALVGTSPAGTDLVSLGDDNIRDFKSAVLERVNSRFVDVNSDPWIIKSPAGGTGNAQSLVPAADNSYTLGTAALRFSDLRTVSATISAGLAVGGLATFSGGLTVSAGATTLLAVTATTLTLSSTLTMAAGAYQLIGTNRFALGSSGDYNALYTGATNGLRIVNQADTQIRAVFGDTGGFTLNAGVLTTPQQMAFSASPTAVTQLLLGSSSVFGTVGSIYSSGAPTLTYNASQVLGADSWVRSLVGADSYALVVGGANALQLLRSPSGTANGTLAAYYTQVPFSVSLAGAGAFAGIVTAPSATLTGLFTIPGNTGLKFSAADAGLYQIANRVYVGQYSASTFAASVDFTTGNLTVPAGGVTVTGPSTISGNGVALTVTRNTSAGVALQVTNDSDYAHIRLQSNGVNKSAYLTFNVTGTGNAIIQVNDTDRITVTPAGAMTVASTLTVSAGGVVVTGASTFNSNISLAGGSTLLPGTDNTGTIGSAAFRWAEVRAVSLFGALTGNATTATTLATARTINGVSFDGSANITITTAPSGLSIGGGVTIQSVLSATVVWDIPNTTAGNVATTTVTVTGAAVGDVCIVDQPQFATIATAAVFARVTSANTVTIYYINNTAGAIDPASQTFRVVVFHI